MRQPHPSRQGDSFKATPEVITPPARSISKHVFLAALQCHTWGRFEYDAPPAELSHNLEWLFYVGNLTGRLAREHLGSGELLERSPTGAALQATMAAVADPALPLLYEGTVGWRSFVARADALRRTDGGWELIEVKSGKSAEDGKIKAEYVDDIAYTLFVARASGLPVVKASLVLINREYRLGSPPLFTAFDVTALACARADEFAAQAPAIEAAILAQLPPPGLLQFTCRHCPHFGERCVGKDIPDPLFVVPRLGEKKFEEVKQYERISRLPNSVKFTDTQQRVVDVIRSGQPRIEPEGLRQLEAVTWPAFYLDFEAVMPPFPWFEERPPYDAIPFQYSLDICSAPGAVVEHDEYLATVDGDWRRELAERLIGKLGTHGSIVVYSSYEKTRLKGLAALFPDLAPALEALVNRLFDLELLFNNGYIHPAFAGRTSIKKVLPVMTGGASYDSLAIGNGTDAAAVFALMRVGAYESHTHAAYRANLLEYCGLDTRAMVHLHAAVVELARRVGRERPEV